MAPATGPFWPSQRLRRRPDTNARIAAETARWRELSASTDFPTGK